MSNSTACQLLVSANTLDECTVLQDLKVPWIDLKEPRHGALGRPSLEMVTGFAFIMASDPQSCNWSIAGGELSDWEPSKDFAFLESLGSDGHIKWGLAQCEKALGWTRKLGSVVSQLPSPRQAILVHYADHQAVASPSWETVLQAAQDHGIDKILIDTAIKNGSTLLDWLPLPKLIESIHQAHDQHSQIAIAGSIPLAKLDQLSELHPDWIGLRGAVCSDPSERTSNIDAKLVVRALASVCKTSDPYAKPPAGIV